MRAASEPPTGKGLATGDGVSQVAGNPFYSEKARLECQIHASRPQGLPEQSPDAAPVGDVPSCVGKGRGAQSSGKIFVTPPSKASGYLGEEDKLHGKQTEGRVPGVRRMGELGNRDEPGAPMEDSFQRALEVEIVQHLREQNAQLMSELERLKRATNSSSSGDGSTPAQSWVEIPSEGLRDGCDSKGEGGRDGTPRNNVNSGKGCRYTPNGTRVPDGTPPGDESHEPSPAILPPVPPFPTLGG